MNENVLGLVGILAIVWVILRVVGDWIILRKAGRPGWHSIIPILNMYDEYDICWKGSYGILYTVLYAVSSYISSNGNTTEELSAMTVIAAVIGIVMLVLEFKQSRRLAWAFGKSGAFGIFLFIFGGLGRIILGLGSAEYVGKPDV